MHASVRALLDQIIDYAGLFPPAKLPLEEALREYAEAIGLTPHRWMLGRFVCPVVKLPEIMTWAKSQTALVDMTITALGRPSTEPGQVIPQLADDLHVVQEFCRAWVVEEAVETIEVALPVGAEIGSLSEIAEMFRKTPFECFVEIPMSDRWQKDVESAADLLSNMPDPRVRSRLGLKLRCGGVTAEAFPSDEHVAHFIDTCRRANTPWKATAGLHHPRRHWDATLNVWHHGFLNVFIAAVLARVHALRQGDIVEILADRDGEHFHFADESLGWRGWSCTTAQIEEARTSFAMNFGCCSFEEPCAGLLAMGLLD